MAMPDLLSPPEPSSSSKIDLPTLATLIAMNAALHVDHLQTREIARRPDIYHEHNLLLGKHPSARKVGNYFLASHLLNSAIMLALPKKYGLLWGNAVTGLELGCIGNNKNIGIKIRF